MRFCYPWRDYQAAVLEKLDAYLDDRKLHVAAAPGAGKTVLGLEIMRRLSKPTLILAPSLAIRGQWVDRLKDLFLPPETYLDWVSTDISHPKVVTVATYQALHMDGNLEALMQCGIEVIVLDEAHHLRKSWWETLEHVVDSLNAQTISLTATPPYDVSSIEWQRYNALCGPLDAEINIPELVKSGDLAPHQDLVYHTVLGDQASYLDLERQNDTLRSGLRANDKLCTTIENHPWMTDTRRQVKDLLSNAELFSAMLIYLADAGHTIPNYALRVLGVGQRKIPRLTDNWLEILCQGLLSVLPDELTAHMTRHGALTRGRVSIPVRDDHDRHSLLRNAAEKYDCVRDITLAERNNLKDRLRLAILTEHVGANAIKVAEADPKYYEANAFRGRIAKTPKLGRIDAGSIFERLRLEADQPADMAVLTGSLCIVPSGSLKGEGVTAEPLKHDPRYDGVTLTGAASDQRVKLVSNLMAAGVVRILIGTRALLGQGWDLPVINTLILATNVRSFVSSNQLRGRAIRCDPQTPEKVANIWHIATAAPADPGPEVQALKDRFDTFMHLDTDQGLIRSGFGAYSDLSTMNARSLAKAAERDLVAHRWQQALATGGPSPHVQHRFETSQSHRGLVRADAIAHFMPRLALSGGLLIGAASYGSTGSIVLGGCASAAVLFPALKRLNRVVKHGTRAGSLLQTGYAVLHTMIEAGYIRTQRDELRLQTGETSDGLLYCTLDGATLPEETRFLAALEEVFAPIDNPRYLIIRESYLGRILQIAPYTVPRELAKRKELARMFQDSWNRYVGPAKLVYTRTMTGRAALLKARMVSLDETRSVRRSSVWQ